MPSRTPQPKSQKPPKRIKVLQLKNGPQKSFFSEYFYPLLGIIFAVLVILLKGFDFRWDEAIVVALWPVALIFIAQRVYLSRKGEDSRSRGMQKEKKKVVRAAPVKKYKPPEVPRVSKDFSPLPPRGVKGYPPPSPFIKPPK